MESRQWMVGARFSTTFARVQPLRCKNMGLSLRLFCARPGDPVLDFFRLCFFSSCTFFRHANLSLSHICSQLQNTNLDISLVLSTNESNPMKPIQIKSKAKKNSTKSTKSTDSTRSTILKALFSHPPSWEKIFFHNPSCVTSDSVTPGWLVKNLDTGEERHQMSMVSDGSWMMGPEVVIFVGISWRKSYKGFDYSTFFKNILKPVGQPWNIPESHDVSREH